MSREQRFLACNKTKNITRTNKNKAESAQCSDKDDVTIFHQGSVY
jgi:hypothetical protein